MKGFLFRALPIVPLEEGNIPLMVALNARYLFVLVVFSENRLGEASVHRDEGGLVILVTILVNHDHYLSHMRKDDEIVTVHQMRVDKGEASGQEWLRDSAFLVHGV